MLNRICRACSLEYKVPGWSKSVYCSKECRKAAETLASKLRMRKYRLTPQGQAKVKADNLKYCKRPDIPQTCQVCKGPYLNARKTYTCEKPRCRALAHYEAQKAYRQRHPEKVRARDRVNKFMARNRLAPSPCGVCGSPAQFHHTDYTDNKDVQGIAKYNIQPLCSKHHSETHQA